MKLFFRACAGLLAAALPASAQVLVLPTPRLAVPLAPVTLSLPLAHPMGEGVWGVRGPLLTAAPSLSLPSLPLAHYMGEGARGMRGPLQAAAPRFEPRVPSAMAQSQVRFAQDATLDALVVREGASEEFYLRVRALVSRLPPGVLFSARELGYRIQIKEFVTQGRPELQPVNDTLGGLHSWGKKENLIIVAEKVLVELLDDDGVFRGRREWQDSRYWENAVLHELGHVLDRAHGLADDPAVRAAMDADFSDIPDELRRVRMPDGRPNRFYYFLQRTDELLSERARSEICAESFDVLLRGERSSYNYANFTAHLPRTLAALRAALEARLGPLALVGPVHTLEWGPFRAYIGPPAADGDARVEIYYRGVRYPDPMALSAAAVANGEQGLLREFFAKLDEAVERYRAANRG